MQAKVLHEYIRITIFQQIEGIYIAETDCADYQQYKSLPDAIEVEGIRMGKTGWSSDKNYACYQSRALLGTRLDVKG